MTTFKTAIRIVVAHKLYIFIYLFGLSGMMIGLLLSSLGSFSSVSNDNATFTPTRASVAVIDRDKNTAGISQGLREYLGNSQNVVQVTDTAESLQDAVAKNFVDYIVVVPQGFAESFEHSVASNAQLPSLPVTISYTSSVASIANMRTNGFLRSLRTAYIARTLVPLGSLTVSHSTVSHSTVSHSNTTTNMNISDNEALSDSVHRIVAIEKESSVNKPVEVVSQSIDTTLYSRQVFSSSLRLGIYPILTAMIMCIAMVIGVLQNDETKRRMAASSYRPQRGAIAMFAACLAVGGVCVVYYSMLSFLLLISLGGRLVDIDPTAILLGLCSLAVYTFASASIGFAVGQWSSSEQALNGFANVAGLLISFTSGIWLDPSIMPSGVIAFGKLLPGWWYSQSLNAAFGTGTESSRSIAFQTWGTSTLLVIAFSFAVICLGLAAGTVRRRTRV